MAAEGQYVATRLFQTGSRTFPYFQECDDRIMKTGDLVRLDTDALGYEGYAVYFHVLLFVVTQHQLPPRESCIRWRASN